MSQINETWGFDFTDHCASILPTQILTVISFRANVSSQKFLIVRIWYYIQSEPTGPMSNSNNILFQCWYPQYEWVSFPLSNSLKVASVSLTRCRSLAPPSSSPSLYTLYSLILPFIFFFWIFCILENIPAISEFLLTCFVAEIISSSHMCTQLYQLTKQITRPFFATNHWLWPSIGCVYRLGLVKTVNNSKRSYILTLTQPCHSMHWATFL